MDTRETQRSHRKDGSLCANTRYFSAQSANPSAVPCCRDFSCLWLHRVSTVTAITTGAVRSSPLTSSILASGSARWG